MTPKPRREPHAGSSPRGLLPPTQLLQRNLDRIRGTNLLLVGVPSDEGIAPMFGERRGVLLSFDYGAHLLHERWLSVHGAVLQPRFGAAYDAPEPRPDVVVAYLQKGREANDWMLAMAGAVVSPGGTVFLVGENSAGIRSTAAILKERVGGMTFSDAARHCALYEAQASDSRPGVALESWEKRFSVTTGSGAMDIVSLPGVFSHGRLDEGTALLLRHLPTAPRGSFLDFGCGCGVIGAAVKAAHPECEVALVDASAFALQSTRRTFAANGLTATFIRPADGLAGVDECFDVIVSNPPFHQGIATNYEIVSTFLASCESHLRPGGCLLMVANRFLPYEGLLRKSLEVSLVAEDTKYKVLKGTRRS